MRRDRHGLADWTAEEATAGEGVCPDCGKRHPLRISPRDQVGRCETCWFFEMFSPDGGDR